LVDQVVVIAAHCPLTQEAEQRLDEIPPFDQLHSQIYEPLDIVTTVGTPDEHKFVGTDETRLVGFIQAPLVIALTLQVALAACHNHRHCHVH